MKAPNKCPVCKEKKKWAMVDKGRTGNAPGAAAGAIAGAWKGGIAGAVVGGLIGNALGKGKKVEQYVCGNCGFTHTYEA